MIERSFQKGDAASVALYSPCEKYRYSLTRIWEPTGERVGFIMLNPSTATEAQNDPTVERCEQRARKLGFGAFNVTNIFAWRDTDPRKMRAASDPVGPENDKMILRAAQDCTTLVAAWGSHGDHLHRGAMVKDLLKLNGFSTHHLGLTKAGEPRHPLYISYAQNLIKWF